MRQPSTRALALVAALAALALAAPAQSSAAPILGVGDQKPNFLTDPLFQQLRVKHVRLIVPYNVALSEAGRAGVDNWVGTARSRGQRVMIAFNPDPGQAFCPNEPCSAPSVSAYTRAVRAFHSRWGRSVEVYQPWNESNSRTQPTAGNRGARLVARYYLALKKLARRKLVTGADIQDIGDFKGYTRTFLRAVGRRKPKVMGFHNYTDTNRFFFRSTDKFVKAMPRGTRVWLTETGAVHELTLFDGRVSLRADEDRGARSMRHLVKIVRRHRRKIDRVYIYQWQKTQSFDRFDAGIVNPDGSPRKSYFVLRGSRRAFAR